ncbi:MAG: right-handed parallel beta-helix repeat-containing protein [Halioglobus sp.]|nr:right-handed parallel beta-helix repeat-containing protein [Halioglobus sp.]
MTDRNNRNAYPVDLRDLLARASLLLSLTLLVALTAPAYASPYTPANPHTLSKATTWLVGPERKLKTPGEAARLAKSGDTVEIDAGVYRNDYAEWVQENLTIRGVGGMAHLQSTELIPNGKAIWIVSGNNTAIENIEFSGARVPDTNGAGIRHEGGNLTLRNTYFHHNEFSVLTGAYPEASLDILSSRFWFQKREGTFSHGIYVGALKRFTLTGSHIKGTDRGHQIKSRALQNHILYNRIEDVAGGNSSRLVDLPNCGLSFIIGNDMQQAESTENIDAIGYGAEGCDGRSARQRRLFVVNNTFVNEALNGTLVKNHTDGDVLVANNLIFGGGYFLLGKGVQENNVSINLGFRQPGSWAAPADAGAIDAALALPEEESVSLVPVMVFDPPLGTAPRATEGPLDIGSREAPR